MNPLTQFRNSPIKVKDYTCPATGRVYLRTMYRNLKKTVTVRIGGKDRFISRRTYLPARHD